MGDSGYKIFSMVKNYSPQSLEARLLSIVLSCLIRHLFTVPSLKCSGRSRYLCFSYAAELELGTILQTPQVHAGSRKTFATTCTASGGVTSAQCGSRRFLLPQQVNQPGCMWSWSSSWHLFPSPQGAGFIPVIECGAPHPLYPLYPTTHLSHNVSHRTVKI